MDTSRWWWIAVAKDVDGGLAGRVYAQIKANILTGRLRPGDVIAAHQVAQQLDVSRTPAHEALKRLVAEGYLVTQPRIGYTVTPINIDELRDLFQVRIRLECLAAELAAARFTDSHTAAFEDADREARRLSGRLAGRPSNDPEVVETVAALHSRFHEMIADVSGNRRLSRLIAVLQEETQRFWSLIPGYPAVRYTFLSDPGHREIYDAIASGSARKARAAVSMHMRNSLRDMLESLVPPEPPAAERLR